MSQTLVLHLSDEAYTLIQQQAVTLLSQRLNLHLGLTEAEKLSARK